MNKELFSSRHPRIMEQDKLRQYAVLIPIINVAQDTYLLFEKRSSKLRHHPGEICFPGGKLENSESLEECAVRETMEELQISTNQIEVLGPCDIYISPFNLMISPFLGVIKDYQNTFGTDEVEEIIKVPLDFFRYHQPEKFQTNLINEPAKDFPYERIPGGDKYEWGKGTHDLLFYQYEDYMIWGMTAQIVKSAVKLIDEYQIV